MAATEFDYKTNTPKVQSVLREALGDNSTIATSEGYLGRIHVKVVSELLNGKSERQKQEYLWDILRTELKEESQAVSLVLGYGTDEL